MSDYIFPFSSELFVDVHYEERLPHSYYNGLTALMPEESRGSTHNDGDEIDAEISATNYVSCEYMDSSVFPCVTGPEKMSIIFNNINSLMSHIDDFETSLLTGYLPSVIGFCETKLDPNLEHMCKLTSYNAVFNSKSSRSGGVALFIKDDIKFELVESYSLMQNHIESICVEIKLAAESYFVCAVYRRPNSDYDRFLFDFGELQRNFNGKKCFIIGDLNLDLLRYDNSNTVQNFINLNFSNAFYSLINKPTRITSRSATAIDQVWCNFVEDAQFSSNILTTDFSDHFTTFVRLLGGCVQTSENIESFTYRNYDAIDNGTFYSSFNDRITRQGNFPNFSIDQSLGSLIKLITETIDDTCPLITVNRSRRSVASKPWIDAELKILTKRKNRLFDKYCKQPITYGPEYRNARNRLNNRRRLAKKKFYQDKLNRNQCNAKKSWQVLNEILNRNTQKNQSFQLLHDGVAVSDRLSVANIFNKYFVEAPISIQNSLPARGNDYNSYLGNRRDASFEFSTVTPNIVSFLIGQIDLSASGGNDGISAKIVKCISNLIAVPLASILSECVCQGYYPDAWKIARVVPVFKQGSLRDPNNFRPISILDIFAKIFEKFLKEEICYYFESNDLFSPNQWGFRKGVSTNIAVAKFMQQVYEGLNSNEYGIGVFLDLRKAFDIVDHSVLLNKLDYYGIRGAALRLIASFLSNRSQYVSIGDIQSEVLQVHIGTPQGSCLSPLLFKIFFNDITSCSTSLHFTLFADDTSLYMRNSNLLTLYNCLNEELSNIGEWLVANKLALNVQKTVYMLFSGRKPLGTVPELYILDQNVARVSQTKFLGIFVDEKLNWKSHINHVIGKVSRMVGILAKTSHFLTPAAMLTVYYSLIYPHLLYGIIFWGAASAQDIVKLFKLQKKCIRLLSNSSWLDHTSPLFNRLKILKLCDIKVLESTKFIHSDIIQNNFFNFTAANSIHHHHTRNRSNFLLPQPRTNILRNSVFFNGLKLYNDLPANIKCATSKDSFKYHLKKHLLYTADINS